MRDGLSFSHRHAAGQPLSAALAGALDAAGDFARQQALDIAAAQRLAIVVEELVANLLDHAEPARGVNFTLHFAPDAITLEDDAAPFDPRQAPVAERPNPERGGGVGLALVLAWCEVLSYDSAEGCNRLMLRLRPPA